MNAPARGLIVNDFVPAWGQLETGLQVSHRNLVLCCRSCALLSLRAATSPAQPSPAPHLQVKISGFQGSPKKGNTPPRREGSFRDMWESHDLDRPVLGTSLPFQQPVHARPPTIAGASLGRSRAENVGPADAGISQLEKPTTAAIFL